MIYSNLNKKGYYINLFSYYYTWVLLKNSIYVQVEETKKQIKCVLSTAADHHNWRTCSYAGWWQKSSFKYIKLTFQEILHQVGLLSAAQEVTQRI